MPRQSKWQVYGKARRGNTFATPAVRVSDKGFTLNLAAHEALGLATHVLILTDGQVVGLEGADAAEDDAYSVTKNRQVNAGRFIRERRLVPGLYEADMMVVGTDEYLTFTPATKLM